MAAITVTEGTTWAIAVLATGGVIARPWRWPEAVWAVLGAASLVSLSLVPWRDALGAVERGTDVYLFLAGMMLLAELARQQGVFDWLAALAARHANGSAHQLFALVFGVGTAVTVFLSNDATAVVLTPAVYAVTKVAKAKPLPYLFVCTFIANSKLCLADFQSGELRRLRQPHAAAVFLAGEILHSVGALDRSHLHRAPADPASIAAGADYRLRRRSNPLSGWPHHRLGHCRGRRGAAHSFLIGYPSRAANLCRRGADRRHRVDF